MSDTAQDICQEVLTLSLCAYRLAEKDKSKSQNFKYLNATNLEKVIFFVFIVSQIFYSISMELCECLQNGTEFIRVEKPFSWTIKSLLTNIRQNQNAGF